MNSNNITTILPSNSTLSHTSTQSPPLILSQHLLQSINISDYSIESFQQHLDLYFNETITREKKTPLHIAAEHGLTEYVQLFINAGVNVNIPCLWEKITPLHLAAEKGFVDCVKLLIESGADVNLACFSGLRPLHSAAKNGHADCVDLLIKAGANLNHQYSGSGQAMTALHDASKFGHADCVRLLINAGANFNLQCSCLTPLHHAAKNGREECIKLLVEAGTDVNLKCNWSTIRTCQQDSNCCQSKHVNALVKTGANLNLECFKLMSPLHSVIENGQHNCIEILLQNGADLNSANEYGLKPFHTAAMTGNITCIEILLKNGCDINIPTEYQNCSTCSSVSKKYDTIPHTALYYALLNKQWECAKYLLDHRCKVEENVWNIPSLPRDIYCELRWNAYRREWFIFLYSAKICGNHPPEETNNTSSTSSTTTTITTTTSVPQQHANTTSYLSATTRVLQSSDLRRYITEYF